MSEDRQRTLGDRTPSRGVRPAALLALALVVILVLAACGGSSSSEVDASAGGSDVAGVVQADDLAQPAQEPDAPAAAEGDQAAPDVGEDTDATTADTIEEISPEDAFPVFAQCLRDEGLDVTDPDFTSGRGPGGFLRDLDRDDPAVEAATETCRPWSKARARSSAPTSRPSARTAFSPSRPVFASRGLTWQTRTSAAVAPAVAVADSSVAAST